MAGPGLRYLCPLAVSPGRLGSVVLARAVVSDGLSIDSDSLTSPTITAPIIIDAEQVVGSCGSVAHGIRAFACQGQYARRRPSIHQRARGRFRCPTHLAGRSRCLDPRRHRRRDRSLFFARSGPPPRVRLRSRPRHGRYAGTAALGRAQDAYEPRRHQARQERDGCATGATHPSSPTARRESATGAPTRHLRQRDGCATGATHPSSPAERFSSPQTMLTS